MICYSNDNEIVTSENYELRPSCVVYFFLAALTYFKTSPRLCLKDLLLCKSELTEKVFFVLLLIKR